MEEKSNRRSETAGAEGPRRTQDRRQSDQSTSPDRRTADRRQQTNRRRKEREVEVFQWESEPKPPRLDAAKVKRALIVGTLAALIPLSIAFIYFQESKPTPTQQRKKADPFQEMAKRKRKTKKASPSKQHQVDPSTTLTALSEDVLNIAPHIYYSVRLELVEGGHADVTADANLDLKSVFVRLIEILTRSEAWDMLQSSEKIELLHGTFDLLQKRYPYITRFIRLIFDDGRKNLDLKFDDIMRESDLGFDNSSPQFPPKAVAAVKSIPQNTD